MGEAQNCPKTSKQLRNTVNCATLEYEQHVTSVFMSKILLLFQVAITLSFPYAKNKLNIIPV